MLSLSKWLRSFILRMLDFYQHSLSPIFGASCRFYPSCSEYSRQCFIHYGLVKASLKTIYRIFRCQPLFEGFNDEPVPALHRIKVVRPKSKSSKLN